MNHKLLSIGIVLTLLFSLLSAAECHPNCPAEQIVDPYTFNPNDPSSFNYINGNYATISDWSLVDWSQIPAYRIPEVPASQLNYLQLNFVQRQEMSVEQISTNFENIENLGADVNTERARMAIQQTTGVTVQEFGSGAKIRGVVLIAEEGQLDFTGKSGWIMRVNEKGNVVIIEPLNINEASISPQDYLLIQAADFTTLSGETHSLEIISFRNGQAYVEKGYDGRVDTYEILAITNGNIYFGKPPEQPEGDYISIADDVVELGSKPGGGIVVTVLPGNELLAMVRYDYSTDPPQLIPSSSDRLGIGVYGGDRLHIISRESEKKTPLIQHYDGGGSVNIRTGRQQVLIGDGQIKIIPPEPLPLEGPLPPPENSVAFELRSDSPQLADQVLFTSSSNRYALFKNRKEVAGSNLGLTVSNNRETNLIKTVEDLRHRYPNIKFTPITEEEYEKLPPEKKKDLAYGQDDFINEISAHMAQVVDQWLQENPDKKDKIGSVVFTGEDTSYGTATKIGGGGVTLGERNFDPATVKVIGDVVHPERPLHPLLILNHEFAHVEDVLVKLEENNLLEGGVITPEQLAQGSLEQKYNVLVQQMYDILQMNPQYQTLVEGAGSPVKLNLEMTPDEIQRAISRNAVLSLIQEADISTLMIKLETARFAVREADPPIQKLALGLPFLLKRETGGFPLYAFSNTGDQTNPQFRELSSTYTEIPRENVRREIARGNVIMRSATQLAYDAGKMDSGEYRYRMGDYCRAYSCGRCRMYTLTCRK